MSMTPASTPDFAMGRVALTVRDLAAISDYYQKTVGLQLLASDGESATLGAGSLALLELRLDKAARIRSPREAGLFHTAFLLPTRGDLARWTQSAIDNRYPVTGASDHAVSEAIYLTDPEGNGIEIYADRPQAQWRWSEGKVSMGTEHLDIGDLLTTAEGRKWQGAPEGTIVGHVHLQVGAVPEAEAFYASQLGLDITTNYTGAAFYSANGYHHHIATNTWNSRGAGVRDYPSTGLAEMEIRLGAERLAAITARTGTNGVLRDPWGTEIALKLS